MANDLFDSRKMLGDTISELARTDERIVVVSADSAGRTGLKGFMEKYPERYFEVGIMEQSAMSVASGLATTGRISVFVAPAPFATGRAFEMLKVDVGYMRQNVKVVGRNCGVNYGTLGPTHYGLDDIALARVVPGITIIAPQDISEMQGAIRAMMAYEGPVYLRFSTSSLPRLFNDETFVIGKSRLIRDGNQAAVITTGEITDKVLKAVDSLTQEGYDLMVIGMPTIRPLDEAMILSAAKKTGRIITFEEHFTDGGLGTAVAEFCSGHCPVQIKRIGMPHTYISSGPNDCLYKEYGLDVEGIAKSIKDFADK